MENQPPPPPLNPDDKREPITTEENAEKAKLKEIYEEQDKIVFLIQLDKKHSKKSVDEQDNYEHLYENAKKLYDNLMTLSEKIQEIENKPEENKSPKNEPKEDKPKEDKPQTVDDLKVLKQNIDKLIRNIMDKTETLNNCEYFLKQKREGLAKPQQTDLKVRLQQINLQDYFTPEKDDYSTLPLIQLESITNLNDLKNAIDKNMKIVAYVKSLKDLFKYRFEYLIFLDTYNVKRTSLHPDKYFALGSKFSALYNDTEKFLDSDPRHKWLIRYGWGPHMRMEWKEGIGKVHDDYGNEILHDTTNGEMKINVRNGSLDIIKTVDVEKGKIKVAEGGKSRQKKAIKRTNKTKQNSKKRKNRRTKHRLRR